MNATDTPAPPHYASVPLAAELQRDWAREETAAGVYELVITDRLLKR